MKTGDSERGREAKGWLRKTFPNGFKQTIKDDYMLSLFESEKGSFDNLKKANRKFDVVFMGMQMRFIIWIVLILISIIMFIYFRYKDVPWIISFVASIVLTYMVKYALELNAYFLLRKFEERKNKK